MAGDNHDPSGFRPMNIQGRLARERERLLGMTDLERKWRKQWIEDQVLHNEPIEVPEYYRARLNPIRRFYRFPLDRLETAITPIIGHESAFNTRYLLGKFFLFGFGVLSTIYYFKYNANDWTRKGGWRVTHSKPILVPGDPGYPYISERTKPSHYANAGFDKSPI